MGIKEHLAALGYDHVKPMAEAIEAWDGWYKADNDFYSSRTYESTSKRTYKAERISVKPARMVCQEWASLLLNERTQISCEDETANEWLTRWLEDTDFFTVGQRLVERTMALGVGAWALRVTGLEENALVTPEARVIAQRFSAKSIIPLTYDEDEVTEVAFASRVTHRGQRLTQLNIHRLAGGVYVVETAFFDAKGRPAILDNVASAFTLGTDVPLFGIIRPGLENTYEDYSPFGVSVFDDAIGAIKLTDSAVNNMFKDLDLGQKMLFLDERMLERDSKGNTVVPREKDQQLFRIAELDGLNKMVEEYNPDLRVGDNRLALQTALELLGSRCGMGSDYFSFESGTGLKTATEVVSENSDLFRSVRKHENAIAPGLKAIARGALEVARVIKGEPIPEDVGAISVLFDDSIIQDTDSERQRDRDDVSAGLMKPWEYRVKWNAEDEETARAMTESADVLDDATL